MATPNKAVSSNVTGNFYVDSTCIDCGTCYWMAPKTFKRKDGQSHVFAQPETLTEEKALQALFSCPTNSIGVHQRIAKQNEIAQSFPINIDENVYHCGYHSEKSYGAASYFIQREQGNVLIDSPRFTQVLSKKFELLGGVLYQYLTHKDDIADTNRYREQFNSQRIIHHDDMTTKLGGCEIEITNSEPYFLDTDLLIIPVPGHTKGSTVLLYKNKYLFTGDHLAYSADLRHLYAFRSACWYDFKTQTQSMQKLLDYEFEYVLPGHGAPFHGTKKEMKDQLKKCIEWMKK